MGTSVPMSTRRLHGGTSARCRSRAVHTRVDLSGREPIMTGDRRSTRESADVFPRAPGRKSAGASLRRASRGARDRCSWQLRLSLGPRRLCASERGTLYRWLESLLGTQGFLQRRLEPHSRSQRSPGPRGATARESGVRCRAARTPKQRESRKARWARTSRAPCCSERELARPSPTT